MFESRPGTFEDLDAICRIWNSARPNSKRDPNELKRDFEQLPEHIRPEFEVATANGEVVGYAELSRNIGSFDPRRWECSILVHQDFQRNGVGSQLARQLIERLRARKAISAETWVWENDPTSLAFAQKHGFSETKRDYESLLHLPGLEIPFAPVPSDYEFSSATTVTSEGQQREWHQVFEVIRLDVPRERPPTPLEFSFFLEHVIGSPELNREATTLAFHRGQLVGFSGVFNGVEPKWLDQWLTGVVPEHRGKGLARAMKVHVLNWAQTNGIQTVRTDNDTRNAKMITINEWLGFIPQTSIISMQRVFENDSSPL